MSTAPERACRVFSYVRPVYDFPKLQAHLLYLEQTLVIFPWLEVVFERYPRVRWVKKLYESILMGASFKQSLSRELGVETRQVGRFHRLPASWISRLHLMDASEDGSLLKNALSVAARSLPFIEKSLYPTAPSDCQLMLDAWRFAAPFRNDSLRGYVAASIYTQIRVANSATLLTKLDEWPQILLVNQQLAKLIPASDMPLWDRRPNLLPALRPMPSACMTCTVMWRNGWKTAGMKIYGAPSDGSAWIWRQLHEIGGRDTAGFRPAKPINQ